MKIIDIRLIVIFIVGCIVGIYFKFLFNDSIVIGVMIGLLLSYISIVSTVRELEKNDFIKDENNESKELD